jgi:hypothetical protein
MEPRMLLGIIAGILVFKAIDIIFAIVEKFRK